MIMLEKQFADAVAYLAIESKKVGHNPTRMLNMIDEHGAVGATKRMLSQGISDGFTKVAFDMGRVDLTLEYLIATNSLFEPLFSAEEIRIAKQRTGVS